MVHERLTAYFAVVVLSVWAVVALVSLYTESYTALTAITPVMLIVAGFLFGYRSRNGQA
jgi:hypothetical protein